MKFATKQFIKTAVVATAFTTISLFPSCNRQESPKDFARRTADSISKRIEVLNTFYNQAYTPDGMKYLKEKGRMYNRPGFGGVFSTHRENLPFLYAQLRIDSLNELITSKDFEKNFIKNPKEYASLVRSLLSNLDLNLRDTYPKDCAAFKVPDF